MTTRNASGITPTPVNPEPIGSEPVPVDPFGPMPVQPEPIPVSPQDVAKQEELESISLVDDMDETGPSKVHALRKPSALEDKHTSFARQLNLSGQGATRCRLFHSRIAENPLAHLESIINEWIDSANIEVKQVGHMIGIMEGKARESNLIVMVWY